jgi:hypothetical protein
MACIFLFLSPWLVLLFQKIQISFQKHFLNLKPWFEFEYSTQFLKVPDLKSIQRVYSNLS